MIPTETFWDGQMMSNGHLINLEFPQTASDHSELSELLQLRVAPQNQNLKDGSMDHLGSPGVTWVTWGHTKGKIREVNVATWVYII